MTSPAQRHQLFISYSHKDREWVDRLRTMIKPLEQRHGLDRWDDSRIQAGDLWREEIEKALASARVALLLVSADFLASDFVTREELPELFHAAKQEGLRILWVPLRPCLWKDIPEIEQYQAAIPPGRTLAQMAEVEQEEAFVQIAEEIKRAFQEEAQQRAREKAEQERKAEQDRQAQEEKERERRQADHQQNLRRYAQEFRHAIEALYPLDAFVREGLQAFQQQLNLGDDDVARIEAPLIAAKEEQTRLAQQQEAAREPAERLRNQPAGEPELWGPSNRPRQALAIRTITIPTARIGSQGKGFWGGERWNVDRSSVTLKVFEEPLADGLTLELLDIPTGSFTMGSPAEEEGRDAYAKWPEDLKKALAVEQGEERVDVEAQRRVSVPEFLMGRFPITQAQWREVARWPRRERDLDPDPSHFLGDRRPVELVSWHDAMEFCRRLSARTGRAYSLPSEAQWEYACRAGSSKPFHFGATLSPELANYDASSAYGVGPKGTYRQQTTDVGTFSANAWGLQDMHGNVWEWCLDLWHPSPAGGPTDGSAWLEPAPELPEGERGRRLLRGGSWYGNPRYCRSAYRFGIRPGNRNNDIGFRVCCLPPGSSS